MARIHVLRLGGAVGVVLLASVRCSVALDPEPLQRFDTCENLQLFLEDQILHPGVEQSFATGGVVGCAPSEALTDVGGRAGEGEGEKRVFTTTNTQEAQVDEPDFVKNNGDVIFVLRRGEMIILSAWPADSMDILSRTQISGTPFTMFFDDEAKTAMVVSHFFADKVQTLVKIYDVSDYTAPVELRSTLIDGDFVDGRSVDHKVMLVTHAQLAVNVQLDNAPFADDDNRALLRAQGLGRLLPEVADFIVGQDEQPRVDKAVACENTYAPSRTDGHNILLVHGFDLEDVTAPLKSTGVVAGFSSVYASTSSIYLASTEFSDGGYFTPDFATTRVHKLDAFGDDGAAVYKATGVFTGQIKDELSLDEGPDGSLRMVLTDNSESADYNKQTTSLVVLQEDGTQLKEVARVDDIGRGENVESVRFLGDRAYVVTYPAGDFLEFGENGVPFNAFNDPLAIIDLSDPKSPRLRGQLEVTGYSAYIHPLDDDHILTVGVETDPGTGQQTAMSLTVFDVSDIDHPAVGFRLPLGDANTDSEALTDRHAFTYFDSQKTLAIPLQHWNASGIMDSSTLGVFHIDVDTEEMIKSVGDIEQVFLFTGTPDLQRFVGPCVGVKRSVMISDTADGTFVYAVSTAGVTAAELADGLPTVSTVQLSSDGDQACDPAGGSL